MNVTLTPTVDRLNAGWLMIDSEPYPEKQTRLEDRRIVLLHAFEAVCHRELVDSKGVA